MAPPPGIVKDEWEHQPHNWRGFWRRWRRSREGFRLEVVRTEAMSDEDFFVIGRPTAGRIQEGDTLLVEVGDEPIVTWVLSLDHAVSSGPKASGMGAARPADDEFKMLMALKLHGIGPDSGIAPGTIIREPEH